MESKELEITAYPGFEQGAGSAEHLKVLPALDSLWFCKMEKDSHKIAQSGRTIFNLFTAGEM